MLEQVAGGDAVTESIYMTFLEERFWALVARRSSTSCWVWQGAVTRRGYGEFRHKQASRVAWELAFGPVGEGLEVVRVCGLRRCCNPAHLEAVTHLQAQLRSPISFASINAAKTSCPRGHPYDHKAANGWRRCRTCERIRSRSTGCTSRTEPTSPHDDLVVCLNRRVVDHP